MGRSPAAWCREIQFKVSATRYGTLQVYVCVCVREILTISLNQKFDSTSVLRFFQHNSAGLQIMQQKLYAQLKKFTSLLPKDI